MKGKAKYLFIASMDVDPDKEALFNEVYDTEHIPNILKVPGIHSATRYVAEPLTMVIGGERKDAIGLVDVAPAAGETVVYSIGTLYGEFADGRSFEGVRFIDRFTVRDGMLIDHRVWNDLPR